MQLSLQQREAIESFDEVDMGHRCTISGHIQESYYNGASDQQQRWLLESNKRVIKSLPLNDEWPILTRDMFSFSPTLSHNGTSSGQIRSTYRGRVIYFGGSFSSIFYEWDEWLTKFETLLSRLYWEHAAVMLFTESMGEHIYQWKALPRTIKFDGNAFPPPVATWQFAGGPRKF